MTIRSSIDAQEANRLYMAFEEGCDNAPAGALDQAIAIRDRIGYLCDEFLAGMKALDLAVCNCDGIREVEVLMFDMLRRKNPTGQIPAMIAFGIALQEAGEFGRPDIINRVRRDGDLWATREERERFGFAVVDDEPVIDDDPARFPGYDERI